MKHTYDSAKRSRFVDQWRELRSKDALLRIAADLLSVNVSMTMAFVLWQFIRSAFSSSAAPFVVRQEFSAYVMRNSAIWSLLSIVMFHLNGFYSRTRGYAHRQKVRVVCRAIASFLLIFVIVDAYVFKVHMVSRGVAACSLLLLVATVGGSRFGMHILKMHYRVEPRFEQLKSDRVLVVGGAGYIGSLLVPMLLHRGYNVRVLDSLLFGKASVRSFENHDNCELITGDVRDIEAVVQATKGCSAVIDLAAIVGDPACEENTQFAAEVNRAATRMLIDVCRGHGVERFLFASTCSVYGASDFLMDENSAVAPLSLYAHTKVDSENLLLDSKSKNFHPTILRLATLFGYSTRPRFDLVVNLLTARAVRIGKITIFNGQQWRPFMHVYDAALAFATCLESSLSVVSGEIFNAGSYDLNYQLSDVARMISEIVPALEVEHVDNEDRRNYRVSFDKIRTRIGFSCTRSLRSGIEELSSVLKTSEIDDFLAVVYNNRATVKKYLENPDAERSSIRLLSALSKGDRILTDSAIVR